MEKLPLEKRVYRDYIIDIIKGHNYIPSDDKLDEIKETLSWRYGEEMGIGELISLLQNAITISRGRVKCYNCRELVQESVKRCPSCNCRIISRSSLK